jgi:ABC-2 type transport system ATP-binding protein
VSDSVVETRGLTKRFGTLTAVDSVDIEVRRNEIVGYLGPNGAGKTTTIRLLMGFLYPTAGTARVLGGSGMDTQVRAHIGYLPGELRLDPRYTTNEVVEFFGALRGGVDRARVNALLERFGLDPTRRIRELSTGNRRKVGIVQAFMHGPELLILDEPTSGLDPLLQHEFQEVVREVRAGGASVFLSSHTLPEVEALADKIGIVRSGRLVTMSGIDELRRQARQRIDLVVRKPVDPAVFEALPEVVNVDVSNGFLRLVVEGSAARVIKAAADLEVERIVTHDTDLEDVFLRFYRDDVT